MVSVSGTKDGAATRGKFWGWGWAWGWGLAGDGLVVSEIEQLGATFARRFGTDGVCVREPPQVDELDFHASRLAPPASLKAAFSTDAYDRAADTCGRSFRDARAVLLGLRHEGGR